MSETCLVQRVLGVEPKGGKPNNIAELTQAHLLLTGEQRDPVAFHAEVSGLGKHIEEFGLYSDPDKVEKAIAMMALSQIFEEGQTNFATNLTSWPLYQRLFEQNVSEGPGSPEKISNALLIGSLSALSSAAFMAQAEDIYKVEEKAVIIDIRSGTDKRRQGNFMYGDGLQLPFRDNTLQLVQTNQLLSMLIGPGNIAPVDDKTEKMMADQLFGEVFRVLQPGGHVLMRECATRLDHADKPNNYQSTYNQKRFALLWQSLPETLLATGFTTTHIEEVEDIIGVDYLFDPSRDFKSYATERNPTSIAVYARK
ncbi:MAG TPA: hypothetical protein VLH38_00590 [Patescibacteria group bacterium]|nr:hypothetical protein [Patescibacteria group bacterium]